MLLFKKWKNNGCNVSTNRSIGSIHNKLAKIYQEGQNNKYIQYTIIGVSF